jgi:nitroreductase
MERAQDVGSGQADNLPATATYDVVMELEQAIRTRRTHKAYRPEPVDRAVLDQLFDLARWAPNHNLTNPWRFHVLGPGALERLKAVAEEAKPGSARKLDRAPTLVAACARQTGDPTQDREDLLAAAVAAYIVLLAAHAQGLGGYWRTVSVLDLPAGRAALDISADETPLGLLHLGYPMHAQEPPERAPVAEVVRYLD